MPEYKIKNDLTEDQQKLLEIIKSNSGRTTAEIHPLYDNTISYRTFLRRINDLEKAKLINLKKENFAEGKKTLVFHN